MAEAAEAALALQQHEADVDNDGREVEDDQEEEDVNGEQDYKTKAIAISTNKALTSKFRGVCWNKKNRRWQTAINSSGKYLYLGSYDTEEEAARIFDRAAVRVRGQKARINFPYSSYVDALGNVVPDAQVESLLLEATNPTKPRRQRAKTKAKQDSEAQPSSSPLAGAGLPLSDGLRYPDKTSAEIALKALARLCGPQDAAFQQSAVPQGGLQDVPTSRLRQLIEPSFQLGYNQLDQQHRERQAPSLLQQHLNLAVQPSQQQLNLAVQPSQQHLNLAVQPSQQHLNLAVQPSQQQQQHAMQLLHDQAQRLQQQQQSAAHSNLLHGQQLMLPHMQVSHVSTSKPTANIFSIVQSQLPLGATLDSILPSDSEDVLGVLYSLANSDRTGAGVWNGRALHNLGLYGSDKDAKQACLGALQLCQKMTSPLADQAAAAASHQQQLHQANRASISNTHLAGGGSSSGMMSGWGLQQQPAACKLPELFKPFQPAAADFSTCGTDARAGAPYQIFNMENLIVIPQHSEPSHNSNGADMALPPGNVGNVKVEQVYFNPSGSWQLQISQPDPTMCNGSGISTGTQEVTDESACGNRRNWDEGDVTNDTNKRQRTMPGVSMEFATLRQLATIDVQEALQLFFAASKQNAQPPPG